MSHCTIFFNDACLLVAGINSWPQGTAGETSECSNWVRIWCRAQPTNWTSWKVSSAQEQNEGMPHISDGRDFTSWWGKIGKMPDICEIHQSYFRLDSFLFKWMWLVIDNVLWVWVCNSEQCRKWTIKFSDVPFWGMFDQDLNKVY